MMATPRPSEVAEQAKDNWFLTVENLLNRPVNNQTELIIQEELKRSLTELTEIFLSVTSSIENYNRETLLSQHKLLLESKLPPEAVKNYVDNVMRHTTI
jgi:hypothetical protein